MENQSLIATRRGKKTSQRGGITKQSSWQDSALWNAGIGRALGHNSPSYIKKASASRREVPKHDDHSELLLALAYSSWSNNKLPIETEEQKPHLEISELVRYWHKMPAYTFSKDVHTKVFGKISTLLTMSDAGIMPVSRECAYVSLLIGSLLAEIHMLPTRISRSEEGSIAFSFKQQDSFYSIEVFEDAEIVFLQDEAGRISVRNLEQDDLGEVLMKLL